MNNLPNSHNSNNSNNNNHYNNNHSNNHNNSHPESNNHHSHEAQPSDWHQRMANLVGLEEQIPPSHQQSSLSETPSANPDETPPSHPSSLKTKQGFSSNPFAKVAVVGAATLSVVLVAGAFLTQLMSGTNKQAPKNFPQITRNDNESNKIEQLKPEEEIEILKTKLALAEQAKAVKLAQLQLKSVRPTTQPKPTPAQPRIKPQTVTRVVIQRVPTPAQTVYVPRVVERIVRVPQRVVVQQAKPISTQLPQATQPPVPPQQTPQPTPLPSISPSFELSTPGLKPSELAQIPLSLSIPTPTPTPTATPTPTPTPSLPRVASSPPSPLGSELNSRTRDNAQILPVPNRRNTTANPQETPEATNETTQYTGKSVAVGTNAKAVLATAVFGEANRIGSNNSYSNSNSSNNNNNNNNKNDSQFVVRLREPLKSVDGAIALPANTELLAQLDQVSETGMLNLTVISVVSQNKSNLTETRLRQSAMKVRAPGGRPLLAKKYPDKSGKISGMDTFIFGLGGAGKIGEVLNRPETRLRPVNCTYTNDKGEQVSSSSVCSYISETKQERNIPAAVLEGGMNALVPQLNQRNQQAINEMITKSNIWYLPAGTEVEVVANQITRF